VLLDPPRATVDVNVHPQKAEVRFSDAQRVYAAVRRVLADFDPAGGDRAAPGTGGVRRLSGATTRALDQWRAVRPTPEAAASSRVAETPPARYKLRTAAAHDDYAEHRGALRRRALALQTELPRRAAATVPVSAPKAASEQGPALPAVTLLTCLPGPVAIVQLHDDLLAVHLPTLRSHLVYRRLVADLGAGGDAAAQGLLSPVVVKRPPEDVELLGRSGDALVGLGVVLDPFGEDAVMVRAVPAGLRHCALEPDVVDLVDRIMPWLRVHEGGDDPTSALHALAQTRAASDAADPAPRLARRWIRELLAEGADLDDVPGITRWTAPDLVR
jgi:DNA mismatch repair protein MutL